MTSFGMKEVEIRTTYNGTAGCVTLRQWDSTIERFAMLKSDKPDDHPSQEGFWRIIRTENQSSADDLVFEELPDAKSTLEAIRARRLNRTGSK